MARILEQKETTTLNSSVGADEGQSSTLNENSIAHNTEFVTGNNKDSLPDNFWITRMKHVPQEILKGGKFCCWRNEKRGTKYSKIPYDPKNGEHARSNDPASFSDYQTAVTAAYEQRYSGIGIGIFDVICAIDIDDCLDTNGSPTDMAMDIIKTMHSYTEISPSERGFHILFRADHFKFDPSKYYIMNHEIGLEVYIAGATSKYVTITGSSCIGIFEFDYGDRSEELQNILDRYMLRETRPSTKPEAEPQVSAVNAINAANSEGIHEHDDDKLLDLIIKSRNGKAFRRLWQGDITGYPSQSEADMALCSRLAFWTAKNPTQMDRLFRRSGLMRAKWDRKQSGSTYGWITINRALDQCHEMYTPRTEPPVSIVAEPVKQDQRFQAFRPLKPTQSQLPPFPVDDLPMIIADYVKAVAANTQTAPDMAGTVALGVLAIALQGKYEVMVNPSWTEQLSLLTAVIASPGERKSPVMKLMTNCLDDYERQYNMDLEPRIRKNRQDRESIQRRINGLNKELEHKWDKMSELELQHQQDLLADLEEITQVRLTADDCTSEALTALMAKNKGRIGVVSAEGGIFDILAGRYNNHVNLDIWLKGWSGDMIRVDRLGREAQYIRNPCVSACFAIQPSILSDIMENPVMNGRGLVARFLFSSPPSCIGSRTFFAPSIPADAVSAYRQLVFRLLNTPMMEEARALPLSQEASGIIARHFEENERFLSGSGQVIAEWSNKYIGTILRIAGLMQLAEGTDEMITGPMMQRAIRLGRYYQAHTLYAYAQIGGDMNQQKASFIASQLKEKGIKEIKRQELFQMCRGRFFKKTEDIFPILDLLEEHGYIAQEQPQRAGAGRPPDVRIHVNPKAISESSSRLQQAEFAAFNAFTA